MNPKEKRSGCCVRDICVNPKKRKKKKKIDIEVGLGREYD